MEKEDLKQQIADLKEQIKAMKESQGYSKSQDEKMMRQADQIDNLRDIQAAGIDKMPTVTANRNPKYQVRTDEADRFVIVATRIKHMNTRDKTINNEDRLIHIHKAQFQQKVDEQYFAIYDEVEVVHDPRQDAPIAYQLKHKEAVVKLDTPLQKERQNNAELNERMKELRRKEKELVEKQTELEEREAALAAKETE